MGCGASVDPSKVPVKDEQLKEMCNLAAKDLCEEIVQYAMTGLRDTDESKRIKLEVKTPAIVDNWTATVKYFRDSAKDLEDDAGSGTNAATNMGEKVATGGIMGSLVGQVAGGVDSVLGKAKELASMGGKSALNAAADGIEASIKAFQGPFDAVGNDVVLAQGKAIQDIFGFFYSNYQFRDAPKLIRGDEGQTGEAYITDSAPVCGGLVKTAREEILKKLKDSDVVKKEIAEHASFKAWNAAIAANQKTCDGLTAVFEKSEKLFASDKLESLKTKVSGMKTNLNMEDHIMQGIVDGILKQLEQREISVRKESGLVQSVGSQKIQTFRVVFSKTPLMESHYQTFRQGH